MSTEVQQILTTPFYTQHPNERRLSSKLVENSIFLAGPSLRKPGITPWREKALQYLEDMWFTGTVFVPEKPLSGSQEEDYEDSFNLVKQASWEWERLDKCSAIVMWIPRNLEYLPGFTSNVEFGRYVSSRRFFYGRPNSTLKTGYLDLLYRKETRGQRPHHYLHELLKDTIAWLSI